MMKFVALACFASVQAHKDFNSESKDDPDSVLITQREKVDSQKASSLE